MLLASNTLRKKVSYMWLFTLYAAPKANVLSTLDLSGAEVACWINFPERDGAEQLAQFYLDKEGWAVVQVREAHWVEAEDYPEGNANFGYVQEALKDGASFLIQTEEESQ